MQQFYSFFYSVGFIDRGAKILDETHFGFSKVSGMSLDHDLLKLIDDITDNNAGWTQKLILQRN